MSPPPAPAWIGILDLALLDFVIAIALTLLGGTVWAVAVHFGSRRPSRQRTLTGFLAGAAVGLATYLPAHLAVGILDLLMTVGPMARVVLSLLVGLMIIVVLTIPVLAVIGHRDKRAASLRMADGGWSRPGRRAGLRLSVKPERGDGPYPVGTRLRGVVEVRADGPGELAALDLSLRWVAELSDGGGDGAPVSQRLAHGERWSESGVRSYPFDLPVPAGPPTYDGRHLSVGWELEAVAQVGVHMARAGRRVVIAPRVPSEVATATAPPAASGTGGGGTSRSGPPAARKRPVTAAKPRLTQKQAQVLVGVTVGGALLIVLIATEVGLSQDQALLLGFAVGLPAALALLLGWWLRRRSAARAVGDFQVVLDYARLRPGGRLRGSILFPPGSHGLPGVTAALVATETTPLPIPTRRPRPTRTIELRRVEEELTLAPPARPDVPIEFALDLPVPDDGPVSFTVPGASVEWALELRVEARNARTLEQRYPVTVQA